MSSLAARRLDALRRLMREHKLAAYIVPTADAHASEYVQDKDKRRAFLTLFDGSAGTAVVTHSRALLWTDGRYYLQAEQQLDAAAGWALMRDRLPTTPQIEELLASELARGDRVGIDAALFSVGGVRRLVQRLAQAGVGLEAHAGLNLVDAVWRAEAGSAAPAASASVQPVRVHPVRFAGLSASDKLARVRAALRAEGCVALVVTALDEVAWLFNIRGADVECCPVVAAYAFVSLDGAVLCIDARKLTPEVCVHLDGLARVEAYEAALDVARRLPAGRVLVDSTTCNQAVFEALKEGVSPLTSAAEAAAAAAAVTAAEAAAASSVSAASALRAAAAPTVLKTPYGDGTLLETRGDGSAKLQLPYGVAYMRLPAAAAAAAAEGAAARAAGEDVAVAREASAEAVAPASAASATAAAASASAAAAAVGDCASGRPQRELLEKASPVQLLKSIKNAAELQGMRDAHVRDAVALVTFLSWLETAVLKGVDVREGAGVGALAGAAAGVPPPLAFALTEFSAGRVLDDMRAQVRGHMSPSFETIAGFGPNGAVIHYRAAEQTASRIDTSAPFLLDSGGQYEDGTTDVTRTVHFGAPTPRQRAAYTAVLQGHIALSSTRFPSGTSGIALDALARAPLWRCGLDYRHGTGHGVGAFLNVHEGPQFLANTQRSAYEGGLVEHMTITDEPGYYEQGAFGIRIENVLVVRAATAPGGSLIPLDAGAVDSSTEAPVLFGGQAFLVFEPVTCVPITTKLVEPAMLSAHERDWLNTYNAWCRQTLAPLLTGHALEYLLRETYPIVGAAALEPLAVAALPAQAPPSPSLVSPLQLSPSSPGSRAGHSTGLNSVGGGGGGGDESFASPRSSVRPARPVIGPRTPDAAAAASVRLDLAPPRETLNAPPLASPRAILRPARPSPRDRSGGAPPSAVVGAAVPAAAPSVPASSAELV